MEHLALQILLAHSTILLCDNSSLPSNNSFISVLLHLAVIFQSTAENGFPALDYFTFSSSIADYLKSASLVISHAGNFWLSTTLSLYIEAVVWLLVRVKLVFFFVCVCKESV